MTVEEALEKDYNPWREGGPEGFVWRVERKGQVDFLAKYVMPNKVDGAYLPSVTGKPEVWNWQP